MMTYLLIGLGGVFGSVLRYTISLVTANMWGSHFPFATLIVNIIGAFLLGFLTTYGNKLKEQYQLAIGTGAIGSFTTLSAISGETMLLFNNGLYISAALYMLASVLGGLTAAFGGYTLGKKIVSDSA
ncbi:fluoride efflux transporter CrcB [Cytobacillus purgationiresistens]|uniref:Fluoride-specific ion channel FluC n=1 Tax=Cytobacillus purgationiresistens TaxID=863449 RepID=A0ABU0AAY3_9BACI|nr:fluoride efflux transporter CrcB [Cytobacillus purgationiresistens]MDQ0268411.1 CrcB protein [Cytobacillus purgationiresistens]